MGTPQPDTGKERVVGYVEMAITAEDIENIIITCFEGGSNYWMALVKTKDWKNKPFDEPRSTWAVRLLLENKTVTLCDRENPYPKTNFELTFKDLLAGIKQNWEKRPFSWDKENWDATDCDCILQYALFNEIVFG